MENIIRNGDWIQTYTGRQFWPIDPRVEDVTIEDIAHALSHQCRYSGHTEKFYSVAEHCVRVSICVPVEFALWGLLHDATEAYLIDLPRPLKRYEPIGEPYRDAEARLQKVICAAFGLTYPEPREVAIADNILLFTEKRDLMKPEPSAWAEYAKPLDEIITPWTSSKAREKFLSRFDELYMQTHLAS